MDTELFMECEEEELEPWQQVDDSVEEDDVDFDSYCEPGEAFTALYVFFVRDSTYDMLLPSV